MKGYSRKEALNYVAVELRRYAKKYYHENGTIKGVNWNLIIDEMADQAQSNDPERFKIFDRINWIKFRNEILKDYDFTNRFSILARQ